MNKNKNNNRIKMMISKIRTKMNKKKIKKIKMS